jgi:Calcineurin-like phosphoesterase
MGIIPSFQPSFELPVMSLNLRLRRTRFVCISDTHNSLPKLPLGDVLVHAGDLTNQGSFSELQKTVAWLEKAPFECKLVIAGNHDITLHPSFYEEYGSRFHNQELQDIDRCINLLKQSSSITYLNHEAKTIHLTKQEGPQTTFKVFGSPYSPSRGLWAFGYAPEDAEALWGQVPLDSDIVIAHTPPKFHCDESPSRGSVGCEALRQALWRVRPRLAVCGHVHEARGAETVPWDLNSPNIKYKELEAFEWNISEVGKKKQVRLDLTSRSQRPLINDGAVGNISRDGLVAQQQRREQEIINAGDASSDLRSDGPSTQLPAVRTPSPPPFPGVESAKRTTSPITHPSTTLLPASQGQGRDLTSGRCDVEALSGREGRAETCIVNASILGSSFPHPAGKRFNKPIVIDLELPMADYGVRP